MADRTADGSPVRQGEGDAVPVWRDWNRCDTARLARDPAYDGLFFTCVRTTGIYCRPVCPVAHALSRNVFFVASAAAAENLGYRPCLRCRPESRPWSPAWLGTATTVARAVRFIEAGCLDHGSVEDLADRLGVSSRHLARLFARLLQASPREVARTRRLLAAKRMITDTATPLSEVAFAAGFRSIRTFNEAFLKAYDRPPSSFRRARANAFAATMESRDRQRVADGPATVRAGNRARTA